MRARRFIAMAVLALGCKRAATTNCPSAVEDWARACTSSEGTTVTPRFCPAGGVIVVAQAHGGEALRVEISKDPQRGFVHAGALGLSPVGNFPEWEQVPPTTRGAFDAVVRCARRDPSLPIAAGALVPHPERTTHGT